MSGSRPIHCGRRRGAAQNGEPPQELVQPVRVSVHPRRALGVPALDMPAAATSSGRGMPHSPIILPTTWT